MFLNPIYLFLYYTKSPNRIDVSPDDRTATVNPSIHARIDTVARGHVSSSSSSRYAVPKIGADPNRVSKVNISASSPRGMDKYRATTLPTPPLILSGTTQAPSVSSSSSSRPKVGTMHRFPQNILINILHFLRAYEVFPIMQRVNKAWRSSIQSATYHPRVFEVSCEEEDGVKIESFKRSVDNLRTTFCQARVVNLLRNNSVSVLHHFLAQRIRMEVVDTLLFNYKENPKIKFPPLDFGTIITNYPRLQTLRLHNFNCSSYHLTDLMKFSSLTSLAITSKHPQGEGSVVLDTVNRITAHHPKLTYLNLSGLSIRSENHLLDLSPLSIHLLLYNLSINCTALSSLTLHPNNRLQEAIVSPFPSLTYCSAPWEINADKITDFAELLTESFPNLSDVSIIIMSSLDVELGVTRKPYVEPLCLTALKPRFDCVGRLELHNFHYTNLPSFPELTHLTLIGSFANGFLSRFHAGFPKLHHVTLRNYGSTIIDPRSGSYYAGSLTLAGFCYETLPPFPELTHLSLSGEFFLGLFPLLNCNLPILTNLALNSLDEGIDHIFTNPTTIAHPTLKNLRITGVFNLDMDTDPGTASRKRIYDDVYLDNTSTSLSSDRWDYKYFIYTVFSNFPQLQSVHLSEIHSKYCRRGHISKGHSISAHKQAVNLIHVQHDIPSGRSLDTYIWQLKYTKK